MSDIAIYMGPRQAALGDWRRPPSRGKKRFPSKFADRLFEEILAVLADAPARSVRTSEIIARVPGYGASTVRNGMRELSIWGLVEKDPVPYGEKIYRLTKEGAAFLEECERAKDALRALRLETRPAPRERFVATLCAARDRRFEALRRAEAYRQSVVFTPAEAEASRRVARELEELEKIFGAE